MKSKNTPSTPNPATVALIAELDRIRVAQNLNQGETARRAGKSANMGYKFFNAYRNPQVDSVVEFAAALGYRLALVPIAPKKTKGTHIVTTVEMIDL